MRQESSFNPKARSRAGARGLMQLLPSTVRDYSMSAVRKLEKPETNILYGARYFRALMERFGGKSELALAAYNAGHGKVARWIKRYPTEDLALFLDLIPYAETREYVSIIARNHYWYRWMEKKQN
jgi:soluble lytic murein transglycosylase